MWACQLIVKEVRKSFINVILCTIGKHCICILNAVQRCWIIFISARWT